MSWIMPRGLAVASCAAALSSFVWAQLFVNFTQEYIPLSSTWEAYQESWIPAGDTFCALSLSSLSPAWTSARASVIRFETVSFTGYRFADVSIDVFDSDLNFVTHLASFIGPWNSVSMRYVKLFKCFALFLALYTCIGYFISSLGLSMYMHIHMHTYVYISFLLV